MLKQIPSTDAGRLGVHGLSDWAKGIIFKPNNIIITFLIIFLPRRCTLEECRNKTAKKEVINTASAKRSQQYHTFWWWLLYRQQRQHCTTCIPESVTAMILWGAVQKCYENLKGYFLTLFSLRISEKLFSSFHFMHLMLLALQSS